MDHYISFHPFGYFLVETSNLPSYRANFRGKSFFGDLGYRNFLNSLGGLNAIFGGPLKFALHFECLLTE